MFLRLELPVRCAYSDYRSVLATENEDIKMISRGTKPTDMYSQLQLSSLPFFFLFSLYMLRPAYNFSIVS